MDTEKKSKEVNKNDTFLTQSSISEKDYINVNGSLILQSYIPEELLAEILCYVDHKQLVVCHLVCKRWNELIKKYVWRKKAELISGQSFPIEEDVTWISYYFLCDKKPFNTNFLLSDNVEVQTNECLETIEFDKDDDHPPIDIVPFPKDIVFEGKIRCIIAPNDIYRKLEKKLVIDLLKEGLTKQLLDTFQPIIKINTWYCCKKEQQRANYQCSIKLITDSTDDGCNRVMRAFHYDKQLKQINQKGQWLKFTHIFKNYGKGLRKIKFYEGGQYGVIMAGACVKLVLPGQKV